MAFWSLCGAGLVSNIGDGAVFVGFPILTATLTRDPRLMAGVAVAQRLPWLLLSLVTGALADRFDRRRLIGLVEVLRMVAVGALALAVTAGFHPLAAVYLAAFSLGTLETAFAGASGAVLPELVDRPSLGRANSYLYAAQMSGEGVIGPAVGGLLAAAALSLPFLADSATFALSGAALLLTLPRRPRAPAPSPLPDVDLTTPPERGSASSEQGSAPAVSSPARPSVLATVVSDVAEAVAWFRADPAVKLVAGFIAGLAFCQAAVFSVLILWAQRYLHASSAGYGLLLTVAACGVVGAAVLTGRVMGRFPAARILLVAGIVAAGAYVGLAVTTSAPVAAAILVCEGAAVSAGNVVSLTVRQRLIPPELLGRVGNAVRTCILGAVPAGAIAGGLLAHSLGLRTMFLMAGAAQVVGVSLAWRPLSRVLGAEAGSVGQEVPERVFDLRREETGDVGGDFVPVGPILPGTALQSDDPSADVHRAGRALSAR